MLRGIIENTLLRHPGRRISMVADELEKELTKHFYVTPRTPESTASFEEAVLEIVRSVMKRTYAEDEVQPGIVKRIPVVILE